MSSIYFKIAKLSSIITILPSAMAVGWILGYYILDRLLGTYPWCSILMLLLGAGAGFYEIMKILVDVQRDQGDPKS